MFWSANDVWRVLDAEAPDLVEGSSPWRGGWIAARWPGRAKRVLFMHSDPVASYPHTLLAGVMQTERIDRMFGLFWSYLRRLNACFDASIVSGAWLAGRFARYGLINLHVVPLGVDRSMFAPDRRDEALRRSMLAQCGLDADAALIINVGRHHPEKRLGMVIDAVSLAQRARPIGLWLVGDGPTHRHVREKAAKATHVCVAGRVHQKGVAAMIASADALIHGAASETYGFVVAEALCSGTPVIVPTAGGAGELAAPDGSETFPPGDAKRAADAILRLFARDRRQLARAAIEAAGRRVGDIACHFDALWALYQQIAIQPRRARSA
jgi:alpha-1,6-mannosyltransferase